MNINYKRLYQRLYDIGYHDHGKNHGVELVKKIKARYYKEIQRFVDLGCSNGMSIRELRHLRQCTAYGMDVAPIATRYACQYDIPNVIEGNILDCPYADNYFDFVFTCDMLEHLAPGDIKKALNEIYRIGNKYFFIKVSDKLEQNVEWIEKYQAQFGDVPGSNLHLTVKSYDWWLGQFERAGFTYQEEWETMLVFKK